MPTLPKAPEVFVDPIWEQQPTEHKTHYAWFCAYMSLPPFERTYQKAWNIVTYGSKKEGTRHSDYFKIVARNWRWQERCVAKDIADAQLNQVRWNQRDKERREAAYTVGEKLVQQAKRVLKKIEDTPDHDLKISLSEAKDVAVAGAQLQEHAIPSVQLAVDQMQWLLSSLPNEKRVMVLNRLKEAKENPRGLLMAPNEDTIDAEYQISDDDEEETTEQQE